MVTAAAIAAVANSQQRSPQRASNPTTAIGNPVPERASPRKAAPRSVYCSEAACGAPKPDLPTLSAGDEHHPNSVVTPTTRSSRLERRSCETVKCSRAAAPKVADGATFVQRTIYIIAAAKGLFMANRLTSHALDLTPAAVKAAPVAGAGHGVAERSRWIH